jgi:hypothetical protein
VTAASPQPRFARSAEELVFHTDTDREDYPIYLLPSLEVSYRKPEDEEGEGRFAVFHVKEVAREAGAAANIEPEVGRVCAMFPRLPLREVVAAACGVARPLGVRVFALRVTYEVYRGDYAELVGEAAALCAIVEVEPPSPSGAGEGQRRAVAHTTARRLQAKLPEGLRGRVYVAAKGGRPVVRVKLPSPSPELERLFGEVAAWLRSPPAPPAEEEEPPRVPEELLTALEAPPEPLGAPAAPAPQPPAAPAQAAPRPSRGELVPVYLLSMRLPSRYSAQREVELIKDERGAVRGERRVFDAVAPHLETVRSAAYARISRIFAHVPEFGVWIAVTEEAVEEARRVSEHVRRALRRLGLPEEFASRYDVRAVRVYLEPEDARALLEAAVRHLSADVEELRRRIEEARGQRAQRALRRLMSSLEFRQTLLEVFKRHLQRLQ